MDTVWAEETSGEIMLYSGHEEEGALHTEGIVLMLSPLAQRAFYGWQEHWLRIIIVAS